MISAVAAMATTAEREICRTMRFIGTPPRGRLKDAGPVHCQFWGRIGRVWKEIREGPGKSSKVSGVTFHKSGTRIGKGRVYLIGAAATSRLRPMRIVW